MALWFERWSIRSRILLLTLAILLPAALVLGHFLAADVQRARAAALAQASAVAAGTAEQLHRRLDEAERMLAWLAARPPVRALDPSVCEMLRAERLLMRPEFTALSLHGPQGEGLCPTSPAEGPSAAVPRAPPALPPSAAAPGAGFDIGGVVERPGSGQRLSVWRHAIHDAAGAHAGWLVLEVDLLALSRDLFAAAPRLPAVAVLDPAGQVLLHSAEPLVAIGERSDLGAPPWPAAGEVVEQAGPDGELHLVARQAVPRAGWSVAASLPADPVLADYRATLARTLAIGAGLSLLALGLAWRLSAAIVQPVAELGAVASRVAAGEMSLRCPVNGPPELRAVAVAFNGMLDARALSEQRLRSIFETAADGIISVDEQQTVVEANPAAARMFGRPVEALVGSPLALLIPPRLRERHAHEVRQFGSDGVTTRQMGARSNLVGLHADGHEFPLEASVSRIAVGGRQLATVIHRDITERQRAEQALRESEARLRRLLTHLPEAVIVSSGNRIGFVNQAALRLLDSDAPTVLGRSPLEFVHADSRAAFEACLVALCTDVPVTPLAELKVLRSDGSLRRVEALATLIEHDGDRSVLVLMRDVSELQQAREALEVSHADLRRLIAALDGIQEEERKRIARELHDDLQQTLAAIRMDTTAIAAALDGDRARIPPLLARIGDLAAVAIASTRRIINDLRPQMLEDLGLVPALEALCTRFGARHDLRCTLTLEGPEGAGADELAIAPAVATCLYRVAQEALNNVAKHACATRVELRLDSVAGVAGDRLRLSVADDGQGLVPGSRHKREAFGLLGVDERVRALGGQFELEQPPGGGTVLVVTLPRSGWQG